MARSTECGQQSAGAAHAVSSLADFDLAENRLDLGADFGPRSALGAGEVTRMQKALRETEQDDRAAGPADSRMLGQKAPNRVASSLICSPAMVMHLVDKATQLQQAFSLFYALSHHLVIVTKYRRKCITVPMLERFREITE